jgi:hypothetical protein
MSDDNQIMPDRPELIAMSHQAKEFKSSEFGRYLLDMAAVKAGDAAKALCDVDPLNTKEIIRLQADAKILKHMNEFINQAVQAGDAEYAEYQQRVSEDVG